MAKDFENVVLSQMRDITGLHEISAWPLAFGWWLVLFFVASFCIVLFRKLRKIRKYKASWRYKIQLELEAIAQDTNPENAKRNIGKINDILKRLAIQFYGRQESASLAGRRWLAWLSNRDPSNFNWVKKGEILIDYPYMSDDKVQANNEQIAAIAKAVKPWLKL